jgi:TonB family protein
MIRISRLASGFSSMAVAAVLIAPAAAATYTDYVPPKLLSQGHTSVPIAGSGTVIVQVQVNPNGSHHAMRVIRSTNSGDNAAALQIANSSSYRPATRNGQKVPAFYDFTLRFNGKSVSASDQSGGSAGGGGSIARMIRAGNYAGAKAAATSALASNPSDMTAMQQLGAANYFLKDYAGAANAFAKVSTIAPLYKSVAADSFAIAAVQNQTSPQATEWAKKSVALAPTGNSYYALGVAEMNAKQYSAAAADLQKAHDLAFADAKTPTGVKANIDGYLLGAYAQTGDTAKQQQISAELKQIDPNSTVGARIMGNQYLAQGNAAAQAGKHDEAIAAYLKAAQNGDTDVQVTAYTQAAFQSSAAQQSSKTPDYTAMKSYADKALAAKPDDAQANFAEGVALAGQWATSGGKNADQKTQAMNYLNKAKSLAQSANNTALVLQIDNFVKSVFK